MGDDARGTNQSLKFVEFDGIHIDAFLEKFKMFLGGLDFACWELIATDAGDQANMPAAGAALRTWNQQNRKIISILCLGLPQWCVSIVLENVGEPSCECQGWLRGFDRRIPCTQSELLCRHVFIHCKVHTC